MLNMLAGLEPPTEGEIIVRGKHHLEAMDEELRTKFRRRYIGFVFQSYNNLPQYTALENVALPLAIRGVPEAERNWKARQALSRVGLREHVDHRPSELSGGQQQRQPQQKRRQAQNSLHHGFGFLLYFRLLSVALAVYIRVRYMLRSLSV